MEFNNVRFPDEVIESIRNNEIVVFAGAGVSIGSPCCLPDFNNLALEISRNTGIIGEPDKPVDKYLGHLIERGIPVKEKAASILGAKSLIPNDIHNGIINLFSRNENIRIVTTNYDLMFEKAAKNLNIEVMQYSHPALPHGDHFNGIIHIHGDVRQPDNMIISDRDFGNAYMLRPNVATFLSQLFNSDYLVLFVGYSFSDVLMNYLTRALPDLSGTKRYILTAEAKAKLQDIGLTTIYYEKVGDDHSQLFGAIRELGKFANRGMYTWATRAQEIAKLSPIVLDERIDAEMRTILDNIHLAKLFFEQANDPRWVLYLKDKSVLANLFEQRTFSQLDEIIVEWLFGKFGTQKLDDLLKIFATARSSLNLAIQERLVDHICFNNLTIEQTSKVLLLIDLSKIDAYRLHRLLETLQGSNLVFYQYAIFSELILPKIQLRKTLFIGHRNEYESLPYGEFELAFSFKMNFLFEDAWTHYRKSITCKYAYLLLIKMSDLLVDLHERALSSGMEIAMNKYSSILQPSHRNDGQSFFNIVMIELLQYISAEAPDLLVNWYLQFIDSDHLFLRRVAIIALSFIESIPPKMKINIIEEKIGLLSLYEREEIFALLANTYPKLNTEDRAEFIHTILHYELESRHERQLRPYEQYNCLVWLHRFAKDQESSAGLKIFEQNFPEFEPRQYPDKLFFPLITTVQQALPRKLYNENELFAELKILFSRLLQVKKDELDDFQCHDLQNQINSLLQQAVELGFPYGQYLVDLLRGASKSNNLEYLLRTLSNTDLSKTNIQDILSILLKNPELVRRQHHTVSSMLMEFSKYLIDKDDFGNIDYLVNLLLDISILAWDYPGSYRYGEANLFQKALNCSYGNIALSMIYLLKAIAKRNGKHQIPSNFVSFLELILNTPQAKEAHFVILGHYAFLHECDNSWTRDKLRPHFEQEEGSSFNVAWQGIVTFTTLSYEVAKDFEGLIQIAISHIQYWGDKEVQNNFIREYTRMMVFLVNEPLVKYVPSLFNLENYRLINYFYQTLLAIMDVMENKERELLWHRWLSEFSSNRLLGIPNKFENNEAAYIIQMTVKMSTTRAKNLNVLIDSLPLGLYLDRRILTSIEKSSLVDDDPELLISIVSYLVSSLVKDIDSLPDRYLISFIKKSWQKLKERNIRLSDKFVENLTILGIIGNQSCER